DTNQPLSNFRFLPVEVQRRVVDAQGKPLKGANSWETLDLEGAYRPLVFHSGVRTEADDEKLESISFDGMVMQRLLQIRENQYTKTQTERPLIAKTLKDLDAGQVKESAPNSFFGEDKFDPFKKVNANRPMGPGGKQMPPGEIRSPKVAPPPLGGPDKRP